VVQEARRVLRPGGRLVLTTPNRRLRLLPFQKPWNPEHLREYSGGSLRQVLGRHFPEVEILGIRGPDEVEAIERARVTPDLLVAVLRKLRLPATITERVKTLRCGKPPRLLRELEEYRADDFRIVPFEDRGSFDILAVCTTA